jgi:hypothetical protein
MATYRRIRAWVKKRDGFIPETCWIADVLAEQGRTRRTAANRIDPFVRQNPCTESKRSSIQDALRHFETE